MSSDLRVNLARNLTPQHDLLFLAELCIIGYLASELFQEQDRENRKEVHYNARDI